MGIPDISEWADMMPQTITVEPWLSYKGGGSGANYDTAVSYACRIEMGNHLVVGPNDRVVTAKGIVFLMSASVIGIKDRITLPTGYLPTQPPLLNVDVEDDETGNHHTCLHFG